MKKDLNNKYIDKNGVVHIFIENKKGQKFEALYSGEHMEEVMKATWYVTLRNNGEVERVQSARYNGNHKKLHQVDLGSWVKHINNNPLDNRIENLVVSNSQHNAKNKKTKTLYEVAGIRKNGNGWNCGYMENYNGNIISTKTKTDIEEVKIDGLIAQRYMNYKHNQDLFYLLDELPLERIKEVEDLLEKKIKKAVNKTHKDKKYNHDIENCGEYYKLKWNGKEMLFDCNLDFIKNKRINKKNYYWECAFVEDGKRVNNKFHRELLGLRANDYLIHNVHVDHLNNDSSDNRYGNLTITTQYSNQCNRYGVGYNKISSGSYQVIYMNKYKYWELIGGLIKPTFKTESEAIAEVNRRKSIIDNARVKLKSIEELENLIKYCLDNQYIVKDGLPDLDLGYLYWKGILE